MRKRGNEARHALWFGALVAGLGILILLNSLRRPQPIVPPEPPEVAARRHSPDNAFNVIMEAWELLPKENLAPLRVPSKDDAEKDVIYVPEMGSLGAFLGISRPEDDPELLAYVERHQPALDRLREALKKEYFLYPEVGTPYMGAGSGVWQGDAYDQWLSRGQDLTQALSAYAMYELRHRNDAESALQVAIDGVRFGALLRTDGGVHQHTVSTKLQLGFLALASQVAGAVDSVDALLAAEAAIEEIRQSEPPAKAAMEFTWRMFDNWVAQGARIVPLGHGSAEAAVTNTVFSWQLKRQRAFIRKNRERYLAVAALSFAEFRSRNHGDLADPHRGRLLYHGTLDEIGALLMSRAQVETQCTGTIAALAIERYKRAHGVCPDSIEALVPDYLGGVPEDAFWDRPFVYRVDEGDYWLYSVGADGKDNLAEGHDARARKRDEVVHIPARILEEEAARQAPAEAMKRQLRQMGANRRGDVRRD